MRKTIFVFFFSFRGRDSKLQNFQLKVGPSSLQILANKIFNKLSTISQRLNEKKLLENMLFFFIR